MRGETVIFATDGYTCSYSPAADLRTGGGGARRDTTLQGWSTATSNRATADLHRATLVKLSDFAVSHYRRRDCRDQSWTTWAPFELHEPGEQGKSLNHRTDLYSVGDIYDVTGADVPFVGYKDVRDQQQHPRHACTSVQEPRNLGDAGELDPLLPGGRPAKRPAFGQRGGTGNH